MISDHDSVPSRHYRVELFNGPRLYHADREIPLSRHQRWFLAALFGSELRAVPRPTIIQWFWPNEETSRARRRLNQLLYSFQKKVSAKGVFISRRDDLLPGEASVSSDLRVFRENLRASEFRKGDSILPHTFAALVVNEAPKDFHDWIVARQAELAKELRGAAEAAWTTFSRSQEWEKASRPALVLLELAPTDEHRLRKAVEALVKSGRVGEAESLVSERSQARSDSPSSLLQELRELIADSDLSPSFQASSLSGLTARTASPPLQGRNQERNLLRRTLADPPRAEVRGVLVSGDAGIGKTRLIQEAVRGIPLDGQRVLVGEAAELEQLIPLNPFIEMFRPSWVGETLRNLDEPWRAVLFGVMPGHYPGIGPIPEAPHIQPGSVPRRLFEAFYRLLLDVVEGRPTILVLEDIQWADETTLSVLEFLMRRWESGNLQVVISVRKDEVPKSEKLSTFLENLRIHMDFLEVDLADLEPAECEALIRRLSDEPLDHEDVVRLRSLAGGNPFFLIELTLEFLDGRLAVPSGPQDPVQVPLSIKQVLDRRFSQLSSEADRVLGALAVFSRPLEMDALKEITQLSGNDCLAGLDQLDRFRLIQNTGTTVTISHELVRHTVYQNLSDTRRAWLHDQVGRHLSSSNDSVPPDELAIHFDRAGAAEEARTFATEAADRAEASGAVAEALRFLRIARNHATEPETVADLIHRMGHLHYLHHNLEEAAPLLELAAQRFRRQGKTAQALEAEVERIDCLAQRVQGLGRDCSEEMRKVRQEAAEEGLWSVFQKALDVEVHYLDGLGDLEGVRKLLAKAEQTRKMGTEAARGRAEATLALNVYFGTENKSLRAARRAVRIAEEVGDDELFLHCLNRKIVTLHYQGLLHTTEGLQALRAIEHRFGTCGDLILKFNLRLNQAVWYLEVGELDRARLLMEAVGNLLRGTSANDARAKLQINLGEVMLESGEIDAALAHYEAAMNLVGPSSPHYFSTVGIAGIGLCNLLAGNLKEAKCVERRLPDFPSFWTFDPTVPVIFKARMLLVRQDKVRAFSLIEDVRGEIRRRLIPPWLRLTLEETKLSKLHRPKEATRLARQGLKVAEDLGLETRALQFRRILNSN